MGNVYSIEERSEKYQPELDILAEIIEIVLQESNYPLYGSLIIGTRGDQSIKKLLEVHIGDNSNDSQFTLEQNMCIYADLCTDVMETLHKAALSRTKPIAEGLQHVSCGNPRSFYFRIGKVSFYAVYFATYANETTGREIERIYLAIAEILRRLFPEDEHLGKVTRGGQSTACSLFRLCSNN